MKSNLFFSKALFFLILNYVSCEKNKNNYLVCITKSWSQILILVSCLIRKKKKKIFRWFASILNHIICKFEDNRG